MFERVYAEGKCHLCSKRTMEGFLVPMLEQIKTLFHGNTFKVRETRVCRKCLRSEEFVYVDEAGNIKYNVVQESRTESVISKAMDAEPGYPGLGELHKAANEAIAKHKQNLDKTPIE